MNESNSEVKNLNSNPKSNPQIEFDLEGATIIIDNDNSTPETEIKYQIAQEVGYEEGQESFYSRIAILKNDLEVEYFFRQFDGTGDNPTLLYFDQGMNLRLQVEKFSDGSIEVLPGDDNVPVVGYIDWDVYKACMKEYWEDSWLMTIAFGSSTRAVCLYAAWVPSSSN
ncbi:MAG: hypothetical protein Crog4KO_02640 [Crocinitomicaceae bacterium]